MKKNKNKIYEIIPHTADIGIRVAGEDVKTLFENSAWALFDLLVEQKTQESGQAQEEDIELTAETKEDLLHDWLGELLFLYETRRCVYTDFKIQAISEHKLKAKVNSVPLTKNHTIKTEIKAVTYHDLKISINPKKIVAEIIFDV